MKVTCPPLPLSIKCQRLCETSSVSLNATKLNTITCNVLSSLHYEISGKKFFVLVVLCPKGYVKEGNGNPLCLRIEVFIKTSMTRCCKPVR